MKRFLDPGNQENQVNELVGIFLRWAMLRKPNYNGWGKDEDCDTVEGEGALTLRSIASLAVLIAYK